MANQNVFYLSVLGEAMLERRQHACVEAAVLPLRSPLSRYWSCQHAANKSQSKHSNHPKSFPFIVQFANINKAGFVWKSLDGN